jgi:hypothetical protein
MRTVRTDHQVEAARCGVLEGDLDAVVVLLQGGDGVAEQDLSPVLARVQQDRGRSARGSSASRLPAARCNARPLTRPTRRPAPLTKQQRRCRFELPGLTATASVTLRDRLWSKPHNPSGDLGWDGRT